MSEFLRLIVSVFAVYRTAKLISQEEGPYLPFLYDHEQESGYFENLRSRLGAYDYGQNGEQETNLARGISCPLCLGVYLSVVVGVMNRWPSRLGDLVLLCLGISGAQALLERNSK